MVKPLLNQGEAPRVGTIPPAIRAKAIIVDNAIDVICYLTSCRGSNAGAGHQLKSSFASLRPRGLCVMAWFSTSTHYKKWLFTSARLAQLRTEVNARGFAEAMTPASSRKREAGAESSRLSVEEELLLLRHWEVKLQEVLRYRKAPLTGDRSARNSSCRPRCKLQPRCY